MKVADAHSSLIGQSGDEFTDLSMPREFSYHMTASTESEAGMPRFSEVGPPKDGGGSESWSARAMMWTSLAALTAQTTGQVMLVKWARRASGGSASPPYLNSTIVLFVEIVKTIASLVLVVVTTGGLSQAAGSLREHFMEQPAELLKAAVPAIIYTVQTNLNLYSLEKLSAAIQQVLYQMKIITTAGLGTLMLGKILGVTKWSACLMLAAGIMMVQWPREPIENLDSKGASGPWTSVMSSDKMLGFLAVLTTSVTSGFNAVYIEKMLKNTTATIWMRNVQLGVFGTLVAAVVVLVEDGDKVKKDGLLQGYNVRTWLVISMSALGGLLCAVMLKYAGATLGCFSTAMSIILTCVLSATLMRDFDPDGLFVLGAALATSASLLYGLGLPEWVTSRAGCC